MSEARPLTPRQSDQRERVLEATRQMLAQDGYEGLQMRSLAEAAGVSLMTIYNRFGNKDDVILLGDLNVDTAGLSELGRIPGVESIARDVKTNTRRTKTYDHILIDRTMTREYTGRFGVLDFQRDFGLSEEEALSVSDHQPVWAEFSAYEMPLYPLASHPDQNRK